ncbi:MAG TPA: 30S ribosomal protein S6 [Planktothrix sp. UBA8407]|jgi:ribosomal protein S6|nr:30S ribosomal protein S6 [Planktothrix sp. UBA8402]HAO10993.1 30S ribosomal protein S6 [Planktothrix sp. UBA8407]HBK24551.1 30S ribosomal protein S6 [Planktothrix sp. UBA10369]
MKPFIYETMYILRPDLNDEQVGQSIGKYETILKDQGGQNIKIQNRGKRRLAYDIDKHREGVYVQMNYEGPGAQIAILERAMRISDEVIRYLTIKEEVTIEPVEATTEEPEPESQEAE